MSLFGKKKDEERSENEQEPVQASAPTAQASTGEETKTEEPKKEKTPEELREEQAQIISIKLYPDGQLIVVNEQNCETRAKQMLLTETANKRFNQLDTANLTVQLLIDHILKAQKSSNIIVPGSRR